MTAFIDIHKRAMYWMICGWTDHFGGAIIDYGTWPEQDKPFFKLSEIRKTLLKKYEGCALEDGISKGLEDLCEHIFKRKYRVEGGEDCLPVSLCLIDANWGQSRDVVYQFCRRNYFSSQLMPSHGRHVGPSSIPFAEYEERPGDKAGEHWRIPNPAETGAGRHVLVDVNYWKSFIYERLAADMRNESSLSIFGRESQAHNLLAAHITAEYKTKSFTIGNIVDVWKQRDGKPDNHWLDCFVGCAAGASMLGVTLHGLYISSGIRARPRIKLSEIQREKRLVHGRGRVLTAEDFRRNRIIE